MNLKVFDRLFPEDIEKENKQESLMSKKRLMAFALTFFQLIVIFYIIDKFKIEKSSGIKEIGSIVFVSFFINSFSPLRYRQFILFATCLAVIYFAFGLVLGSVFISFCFLIISCCHFPAKFWIRVLLVLVAFSCLFVLRIELFYAARLSLISSYIASLFMFRIIVYLYEIKYGMIPKSVWESLSYFFMFPNICFLFFPIIDFKTYRKTYYNIPDNELWQKGIRWMLRGLIHIFGYRIVYYYFLINPSEVIDLGSLLQYMFASFALILRLSGLFHFILGLLCLYGLNLPQAFNNYFLATNFTNLWRRINIYWREFVLKIFFYPIMFKLKKVINKNLLAITMICVFIISWMLHGYQWFWIRGFYVFNSLDFIFWLILGGCITINAVLQEKQSHQEYKEQSIFLNHLESTLKMIGMFVFMSVLWSFWGSTNFTDWLYLITKMSNYNSFDILKYLIILFLVILLVLLGHVVLNKEKIKQIIFLPPQHTLFITLPSLLIVCCFTFKSFEAVLPNKIVLFIKTLSEEKLNVNDKIKAEENYYKKMIDGEENNSTGLWETTLKRPRQLNNMDKVYIRTDDIRTKIFKPNSNTIIDNNIVEIDSFGLRDKNYPFIKSEHTFRMALLGGSYEMGSGVSNKDVFENLLEEKINSSLRDSVINNFEIFNFAEGGFYLLQHVELCYSQVFRYHPDAVIYVAHSDEKRRIVSSLADLICQGKNLKYPVLNYIKQKAGAKQAMSKTELIYRLTPFADLLINWTYAEIAIKSYQNNALPIWVFLPTTECSVNSGELKYLKKVAGKYHFIKMDLTGVYGNYAMQTIQISDWNTHPNVFGHKLIANKLYEEFIKNKQLIFAHKK